MLPKKHLVFLILFCGIILLPSFNSVAEAQNSNSSISPLISIAFKGHVMAPLPAHAKDRLLWYKGKKNDDSTLITPQATLVRWSKPTGIIIVQPKKNPAAAIVKELAIRQKEKNSFTTYAQKSMNTKRGTNRVLFLMQKTDHR